MIAKKDISAIILAGGKSSRMGRDKGLIKIDNLSFAERIISMVKPLVSQTLIISPNPAYDGIADERYPDLVPNQGPLRGILTGLTHSQTPWNFVISCDAPGIDTALLQLILSRVDMQHQVFFARHHNRAMPLLGIYSSACKEAISQLLNQQQRKVMALTEQVPHLAIDIPNEYTLLNINTPEDLKIMKIQVNYFGAVADITGTERQELSVPTNLTTEALKNILHQEHPSLSSFTYQLAVNQQLAKEEKVLNEPDQIAVLPPFAGG